MKHKYIDELFSDLPDNFDLSDAKIEVLPVGDVADTDDFMFDPNPIRDSIIPILPIIGTVLFPGTLTPITVTRDSSLLLLREAYDKEEHIGVVAQRDEDDAPPTRARLYDNGCIARIVKIIDMPNGDVVAVLHGLSTFTLKNIESVDPYFKGTQTMAMTADNCDTLTKKDKESLKVLVNKYVQYLKMAHSKSMTIRALKEFKGDRMLVNFIATQLEVSTSVKQGWLEMFKYSDRIMALIREVSSLLTVEDLMHEIQEKTRVTMDKQQREYYLNQQMHVIQEELGGSGSEVEFEELEKKAKGKEWSSSVAEHFERELQKLRRMSQSMPDYVVQLNYLNFMLDLPWSKRGSVNTDLARAKKKLDKNHFGLEKVKERVLEMMAVLNLTDQRKSPVLCLVGPPGTGKTSLGKSIANALGREYVRVALGGVHDEAEVRGHRRTYVGAMPGRILSGMEKAKVSNPVFVLDEIDKVQSNNFSGDPMSALLEVLDPEQNNAFHDNYLDVDYDLSNVLFIATANSTSTINPALLDRMEVIDVPGYIMEEKQEIAKRHLVPRALEENGFGKRDYTFPSQTLKKIVNDYTRESGVRQLEQMIAKVVRNRAVKTSMGENVSKKVEIDELQAILGLPLHIGERVASEPRVAVVTGLAWTQVGGTILFIEACISKGKGTLSMTGNLGDVMKESATLAFEYVKANADALGIPMDTIENSNIHIHVPEGATPKDGPSAGITIFTAIVSAFTNRMVRPNYAMTGEITLRGKVTPVGGIREKILAAKRAGVTDIVLCDANRRDVEEIDSLYIDGLKFHYISNMSEVLPLIFI